MNNPGDEKCTDFFYSSRRGATCSDCYNIWYRESKTIPFFGADLTQFTATNIYFVPEDRLDERMQVIRIRLYPYSLISLADGMFVALIAFTKARVEYSSPHKRCQKYKHRSINNRH